MLKEIIWGQSLEATPSVFQQRSPCTWILTSLMPYGHMAQIQNDSTCSSPWKSAISTQFIAKKKKKVLIWHIQHSWVDCDPKFTDVSRAIRASKNLFISQSASLETCGNLACPCLLLAVALKTVKLLNFIFVPAFTVKFFGLVPRWGSFFF